jgi:hypothetical protein
VTSEAINQTRTDNAIVKRKVTPEAINQTRTDNAIVKRKVTPEAINQTRTKTNNDLPNTTQKTKLINTNSIKITEMDSCTPEV